MTKILATWTKLKTKFKNTLGDKQARIRLLSDKLSEADKELREREWREKWLERWERDKEGRLALPMSFFSMKAFTITIDFSSPTSKYSPSFEEVKKLVSLIRECYCRESLKSQFPLWG